MTMVTKNEEVGVARIEHIYCALQASTERVASALQFHDFMTPKSRFSVVNFFRRMKNFFKEEKLYKLLSALTTIKAVFEVNMPVIVEGKLCFIFHDPSKGKSYNRKIGEAQSTDDLVMYFTDLSARLAEAMAQPEVSQAINSPLFHKYCPALVSTNFMKISGRSQKYLEEAVM